MPVMKKRLPSGKVQVRTPGGVKAKGTTAKKAAAQERLLNAVEHGWKPTGAGKGKGKGKKCGCGKKK